MRGSGSPGASVAGLPNVLDSSLALPIQRRIHYLQSCQEFSRCILWSVGERTKGIAAISGNADWEAVIRSDASYIKMYQFSDREV